MSSERLPTIRLDADGYPADYTLDDIERYRGDWNALLEHIRPLIDGRGWIRRDGDNWEIATGGWSGCESVIDALQRNRFFWGACWYSTRRGGLYEFHVEDWG